MNFRLPVSVGNPVEVFRVDADGIVAVEHSEREGFLEIRDRVSHVAVYVAATGRGEREEIEARRKALIAEEGSLGFNPGQIPEDLEVLRKLPSAANT